MAYFIIDVEILGERITSCETRLIVRNEDGIIEVIQFFFQRHDDGDWSNKRKRIGETRRLTKFDRDSASGTGLRRNSSWTCSCKLQMCAH